jgi:hypothetical protein
MTRMKMMTFGFVLMMFGVQLNLVESFELTPRFSLFLSEHGSSSNQPTVQPVGNSNPYLQASFDRSSPPVTTLASKTTIISPPKWLCWPALFFGTVLVLQGAIRKD